MEKFKVVTAKVQFTINENDCKCSSNEDIVNYLNSILGSKTIKYGNVFNDSIISVEEFVIRGTIPPEID